MSFRPTRFALIALGLVGMTAAVYWQVGGFEFLNFDDPSYVTDNRHVARGLMWKNVAWAFTSLEASNWHPLTWLSHMLDCQLFGLPAGPPHLVNLGLHLANTLLLFLFLMRTTAALWRSAMVAALFALHPLHVESVAWIAERKDVLGACFFLLTLIAYGQYAKSSSRREAAPSNAIKPGLVDDQSLLTSAPKRRWYALALLLFALGLMSKPMLVTVPFVLLLLDFWPLNRLRRGQFRLLEKIPFFCLTAASSVVTCVAQERGGSIIPHENVPFLSRVLNAILAYATYLCKTVWPTHLACFYELRLDLPTWQILLSAAVLFGISVLVWVARRPAPWLLVGWLWYLGMLVPVIGLVQVGTQSMADRYTYLPLIGVFVLLVWGLAGLFEARHSSHWLAVPAGAVLLVCALVASHQLKYWRNSQALFAHAVEIRPNAALSHLNLGHAWFLQGRANEAIAEFQEALRLMPTYALAEFNWANALRLQGNLAESLARYRAALEMQTNFPEAHFACGNVLVLQRNLPEAERHYLEALRQKPDFPAAHNDLGNLYEFTGQIEQAMAHYTRAVELDPDYAEGHYYLGGAFARQNSMAEATAHLRTSIKLKPDYGLALNDLAWILATGEPARRNLVEATQLAERACQVTNEKDLNALGTLATVYAQAGRFPDAANAATRALALARQSGQNEAATILEAQLTAYRNNQAPPAIPLPRALLSPP